MTTANNIGSWWILCGFPSIRIILDEPTLSSFLKTIFRVNCYYLLFQFIYETGLPEFLQFYLVKLSLD